MTTASTSRDVQSMATAPSSRDLHAREYAFAGIAPSPSFHRTSTNTHYDIFINHRGPDVKQCLASTIYHTLTSLGMSVFLDQKELQLGECIPTEIESTMYTTDICIAIFSKNYAQSPWCLAELSFMLETGNKIIPIFYDVQPTDLRWAAKGNGIYAQAFSEHEKKGRYPSEKLEQWKTALFNVSYFMGYAFSSDDDEGLLLKSIVDCVKREMNKKVVSFKVAKHAVGLDAAVSRFENFMMESGEGNQRAHFVGIVGIGGSGKTTLAKELYNQKCLQMERSSFLSDVRNARDDEGLCNMQKKLLGDIVGLRDFRFDNISQGNKVLASHVKCVRMLIVLDGVDGVNQLDALLPDKESFGHGSLVIVTARDSGVLQSRGISSILKMELLNPEHAKQLFCWYAFSQSGSPPEFEDLVKRFVEACNGLPLSLEVFGGMVHGRREDFWESKLEKVSRTLPEGIVKVLKISYDSLDEEDQQMFLDTACFFIGEKKSLAIEIWDGAGWSGLQGLETLLDKCLVEIDQHNRIGMHQHLSDLGKKIANESSPYRIWVAKQINNLRKHSEIRGIMAAKTQFAGMFPTYSDQYLPPFEECMELMENSNRGYKHLRSSLLLALLVVAHEQFTSRFAELSIDLVWLRLFDFKSKYLPSWMSLRNLRVLDICGALSLEDLWMDGSSNPPLDLRELSVAANSGNSFQTFPRSILRLKCLKKMVLISSCGVEFRFTCLPEEFCELENLEHLELHYCTLLSSLPTRFGNLKKLRHLDLCSCFGLRKLPISFKELTNLKFLDMSGCRELRVTSDILEKMRKLEKLFFTGCRKLERLPCHVTDQRSLKELHLVNTMLREVPSRLDQLSKLEILKIGSPLLRKLPDTLNCLTGLTDLCIKECISLHSLPDFIEPFVGSKMCLAKLQHFCMESTNVSSLPFLSHCKLENLQTLKINDCPISKLCLTAGSLCNLKVINLTKTAVTSISISPECCPNLETLQLRGNDDLEQIEELPASVKLIELVDCKKLRETSSFPALRELKLSGCTSFFSPHEP